MIYEIPKVPEIVMERTAEGEKGGSSLEEAAFLCGQRIRSRLYQAGSKP